MTAARNTSAHRPIQASKVVSTKAAAAASPKILPTVTWLRIAVAIPLLPKRVARLNPADWKLIQPLEYATTMALPDGLNPKKWAIKTNERAATARVIK